MFFISHWLRLFFYFFIFRPKSDGAHTPPGGKNKTVKTYKNENKIMLPVSGNVLLYDMSESIHSQRLKLIYDSSGINNNNGDKDKEHSLAATTQETDAVTYVVYNYSAIFVSCRHLIATSSCSN